jgi:hypothetical protein
MSKMMTEIQRNDLSSEWLDMSREATTSNPNEKSAFCKQFEHSKLYSISGKFSEVRMHRLLLFRTHLLFLTTREKHRLHDLEVILVEVNYISSHLEIFFCLYFSL